MPQSLSAVYIHLVFSTELRRPLLRDAVQRAELHSYLGGISKNLECPPILVGGVEDHVHLLCRFGRTLAQAEWVKELKRVSNLWLQQRGPDYADFQWQGGYADFSVSQSNLEEVKSYIARQEEHHRKLTFQDELRACSADMKSNGMSVTSGTETQPLSGLRITPELTQGSSPALFDSLESQPFTERAGSQPWALGRNPFGIAIFARICSMVAKPGTSRPWHSRHADGSHRSMREVFCRWPTLARLFLPTAGMRGTHCLADEDRALGHGHAWLALPQRGTVPKPNVGPVPRGYVG